MTATTDARADSKAPKEPTYQEKFAANHKTLRGDVNATSELFNHYPDAIRGDAEWLRFFCQTRCAGEHALLGKIAAAIGLKDRSGKVPSDQYWYQVVTGRYFKPGGDAGSFARYVAAIRGYSRQQEQSGLIGHQDTKNWKLFSDYVDSRRTFASSCRIGGVEGLTGSQKTWCGKRYASIHNHRETVHLEAPARSTRARVVQKLAELYEVAESKSTGGKEVEIERFLRAAGKIDPATENERKPRTIIIDNVQRLFRPGVDPDQQPIFNYFHELQDDTGFCLILTWVPSFTKVIMGKEPFWAQFLGRMGGPDEILRLEQTLSKADLLKFARAVNVEDNAEALPILKRWAGTIWGIRILTIKLEKARRLATARGKDEVTVSHLQEVDLEGTTAAALLGGGDA